jgi:hypothetical protein
MIGRLSSLNSATLYTYRAVGHAPQLQRCAFGLVVVNTVSYTVSISTPFVGVWLRETRMDFGVTENGNGECITAKIANKCKTLKRAYRVSFIFNEIGSAKCAILKPCTQLKLGN